MYNPGLKIEKNSNNGLQIAQLRGFYEDKKSIVTKNNIPNGLSETNVYCKHLARKVGFKVLTLLLQSPVLTAAGMSLAPRNSSHIQAGCSENAIRRCLCSPSSHPYHIITTLL